MSLFIRVISKEVAPTDQFDILMGCIGFEARSSYLARQSRGNIKYGIAFAFTERKVLSYEKNYAWFSGKRLFNP